MKSAAILIFVLTPLIGLKIDALVQIFSCRSNPGVGLLRSIYLGFFAGLCGLAMIDIAYLVFAPQLFRDLTLSSISNMIIYFALGYAYFHFVGLGETARRIRMLIEIYGSKNSLSLEEILQRYNATEIVKKRVGRLVANGQLICRDGRYFIGKPVVLFIARSVILIKYIFLGKGSEFDKGPING